MELYDETKARIFREGHDAYVKRLSRMSRTMLAAEYRAEQHARGQETVYGGPVSKDELIRACANLRYPIEYLNMTTHVLYHIPPEGTTAGQGSSACEFCQCQTQWTDGPYLVQCGLAPHAEGVHKREGEV